MGYHGAMVISNRRLRFSVALLVVALAGLMVVQAVLLRHAWQLKTQAFDRNVRSALALTVQQLDAAEIAQGASAFILRGAVHDSTTTIVMSDALPLETRMRLRTETLPAEFEYDHWFSVTDDEHPGHREHPEHAPEVQAWVLADSMHVETTTNWTRVKVEADRRQVIHHVVSDMFEAERKPIRERLEAVSVDSVLGAQLRAAGIGVEPDIAVVSAADGTQVRLASGNMPEVGDSPYRARLFGLDFAPPHFDLVLVFPNERAWLLRETAPLFIAAIVFSAIVIAGFFVTVRTLLEQRRFAAQVVGFVNNMTHEFQTPLSTLTLAAEAIENRAGPGNESLHRHTRMIREETGRMGRQVERILQVASLERGDLELVRAPLDGHGLVGAVAESFGLRVDSLGGRLVVDRANSPAPLAADEVHLVAALDNLLENAVKYASGPPDIHVTSTVSGGHLEIRVADRGPGVPRVDRERVFEPYYRCPTGDRHDVKGHGLGLSYVRLVARAHGGEVRLDENPGGGAVAVLKIPLDRQVAP